VQLPIDKHIVDHFYQQELHPEFEQSMLEFDDPTIIDVKYTNHEYFQAIGT
jgi:hypothetical protein